MWKVISRRWMTTLSTACSTAAGGEGDVERARDLLVPAVEGPLGGPGRTTGWTRPPYPLVSPLPLTPNIPLRTRDGVHLGVGGGGGVLGRLVDRCLVGALVVAHRRRPFMSEVGSAFSAAFSRLLDLGQRGWRRASWSGPARAA